MDVEFDCDFRFADTDVAVGAGWVQNTWDQQLLPEVGTFIQKDLEKRQTHMHYLNRTETVMILPTPVFKI